MKWPNMAMLIMQHAIYLGICFNYNSLMDFMNIGPLMNKTQLQTDKTANHVLRIAFMFCNSWSCSTHCGLKPII